MMLFLICILVSLIREELRNIINCFQLSDINICKDAIYISFITYNCVDICE